MRFTINLATRTYLDHRLINRVLISAIIVLLALLAWNSSRLSSNMGELDRLTSEIAAFEARLNKRPAGVSEKEVSRQQSSIRFYNSIIEHKTFDWLGLLNQLESATPEGISLSSLAPEKKSGEFKIEGRAKSFSQVRTYLDRLEDSHAFQDILLLSNSPLALGEKTRGVQFSISCRSVLK
jgi:type IV pilus assembly protein PilN